MTEDVSCKNSRQQSNTFVKLEDTLTLLDYKTQNGGIINWDIASQDILPDPSGRFKIKLNNFPISAENKICVKTKLKGAISTNINIIESRLVETFTKR